MSIFNSDFQQNYQALFKNVEALNEYAKANEVELKGVDVEGVDLDGAEFYGAKFKKVKWKSTILENSTFTKVIFDDCIFESTNLNGSKFVNCVFKNCRLNNTKISRVAWKKGQFLNCQIENSILNKWLGDEVVFTNGKILDTPFAEGKIQYTFKDIRLDGVQIVLTEGGSPLTVEDSDLSEVDFGDSHFSDVVFRRVTQGEGPTRFNSVLAESFTFDDVDMTRGVSLAHVRAKSVRIVGGKFGAAFEGSTIAKVVARDAFLANIDFSRLLKNNCPNPLISLGKS